MDNSKQLFSILSVWYGMAFTAMGSNSEHSERNVCVNLQCNMNTDKFQDIRIIDGPSGITITRIRDDEHGCKGGYCQKIKAAIRNALLIGGVVILSKAVYRSLSPRIQLLIDKLSNRGIVFVLSNYLSSGLKVSFKSTIVEILKGISHLINGCAKAIRLVL